MEAEKMDENEWRYHGEGNKSLVVSHRQHCIVLRFLKFPPNRNKTPEEISHHLQNIVYFGKHIMKHFFGEKYVHHGEVVQLPLDFVKQLCLKIQSERPESRCDKDMDALSGYALCLPNLTRLHFVEHRPKLCIEIKPKCGFLPFSSHVSQEIKYKVCRYCMHQHLKVAKGKWKHLSKYCPLDLFSGNKQRMHFALRSLLYEAQNNLKIFKNGELIYGCKDNEDSLSDLNELACHLKPFFFPSNGLVSGPHCTRTILKELIHVITTILLSNTDTCKAGDLKIVPSSQGRSYCEASAFSKELVRNAKNKVETSGLPKGCLLYKTLQAQMLDTLDIEGVYPLYNRVEQYLEEFPKERNVLQIDGPYNESFYEKLLDLSSEDDRTVAYALTKVQQYRVAMTAKDCSIMIVLSPCQQDKCSIEETKHKGRFKFETLQAQYEEAMTKLKEMQDEILIKNGEIKILRDSMQQMESTMEDQRKSCIALEREKAQCLSEKEKEFSRKLQSLQSELQFRDAEMNELRTKILNCERIKPVTPVSYTSPKKSPSNPMKIERCTQIEKKSYPTEESFGSEISPMPSCSRTQFHIQAPQQNNDSKISVLETEPVKQETSFSCPQRQGSLLLSTLMKQPIAPGSSLGICNILSSNTEAWSGPAMQSASFSVGPTQNSSNTVASPQEGETSLRTAQKLALTGLNLIAVDEGSSEGQQKRREVPHPHCYKIPGAVHLLPLLELHIGAYSQALSSVMKTGSISSGYPSACSSTTSSSTASSVEEALSILEEYALVSLGILYYLAFYSWEVIYTLLSHDMKADCNPGAIDDLEKNETVACSKQDTANLQETLPELEVASSDKSQHPLFKKLLQLLTLCITTAGCQRCRIANQCLRVLVKLAEKSTVDLLISFQCLFNSQSQILLRCISSETPLFAAHLTVRMLSLLAEHQELAAQFCSRSETCLLLALYMYITSRPDKLASERLWMQLEQETVRFLTKCVQCCRPSVLLVGMDCQCSSEVVKALIIMLHRQWLMIRKKEGIVFDVHEKQVVQFLRDAVLLLHGLSQKDKFFHEHCLEVLHQYDGVLPGVTAILRKGQHLKACEELALDELYPLEPEVSDQEMDCR